jgi:hypothetical protein
MRATCLHLLFLREIVTATRKAIQVAEGRDSWMLDRSAARRAWLPDSAWERINLHLLPEPTCRLAPFSPKQTASIRPRAVVLDDDGECWLEPFNLQRQ